MCLAKLRLPTRKMVHKPHLTQLREAKRLTFCKSYTNWTMEDWKKVMFSNYSKAIFEPTFANKFSL